MATTIHPHVIPANRERAAQVAVPALDDNAAAEPIGWTRYDTLFVLLMCTAIALCAAIGVFAP